MNGKKLLQLFLPLVLVLSLTACGRSGQSDDETSFTVETSSVQKAEATLLVYICGSDLETRYGAATKNIGELLGADIPENVNVVLQTGGAAKWRDYDISPTSLQRFTVENGTLKLAVSLPQASMGAQKTLEDFLLWGMESYPAKKYGVILWDHGNGNTPGVCYDQNYSMDCLSLAELDGAFSAAVKAVQQNFSFIGFDACLMANYETMLMVSQYADNMVASEEIEPSGGWDYAAVVPAFVEDDYGLLLRSYADKCERSGKYAYTLSHIDFARFSALQKAFEDFARRLSTDVSQNGLKYVSDSAGKSMGFGSNAEKEGYSDLIDLAEFTDHAGFAELRTEIEACATVVNGENRKNACGISLYYPLNSMDKVDDYIKEAKDSAYKTFLEQNYTDLPPDNEYVHFIDAGSDANGELHICISEDSERYVSRVEYKLFRFIEESEYFQRVLSHGTDSDVISDGQGGYTTSFDGIWVTFQNRFINCSVVSEADGTTVFSTPVKLNGEQGNMRFTYRLADKSFHVQGYLPASQGGEAVRLQDVLPGDRITLMYDERTYDYTETLCEGETLTYTGEGDFSVEPFPDGYFQLMIMVHDIFGNTYYSDCAVAEWKDGHMHIDVIDHVDPDVLG